MGISRKEYWIVLPCPPPGDLPNPGIKPYVLSLMFPALAGGFFTTSTTWQVPFYWSLMQNGNNWLGNKLLAEVYCSNSLTIPNVFMTPYIQNDNPHGTEFYSNSLTEDMTVHFKLGTLELSINFQNAVLSRSVLSDSLQLHGLKPTKLHCP